MNHGILGSPRSKKDKQRSQNPTERLTPFWFVAQQSATHKRMSWIPLPLRPSWIASMDVRSNQWLNFISKHRMSQVSSKHRKIKIIISDVVKGILKATRETPRDRSPRREHSDASAEQNHVLRYQNTGFLKQPRSLPA